MRTSITALAVLAATVLSSGSAHASDGQITCSIIGPGIFSEVVAEKTLGLACDYGISNCTPDGTALYNNSPYISLIAEGASNPRSPNVLIFSDRFPASGPISPNVKIRVNMAVPKRLFNFSTEIINRGVATVNEQDNGFTLAEISKGPFTAKVSVPAVTRAGVYKTVQADLYCSKE